MGQRRKGPKGHLGKEADASAHAKRFLPMPQPLDFTVLTLAIGMISLPVHGELSVGVSVDVHGTCVNACVMMSV